MIMTDEEAERVDAAVAKLPKSFIPLEGDAVPLGPNILISNGTDLRLMCPCAILFTDEGDITNFFSPKDLLVLKESGLVPNWVSLHSFDERGKRWWQFWIDELS